MRFIVEAAVRKYVKREHKKRVSRNFLDLLNRKVLDWIEEACENARAFKTVTEKDIVTKQ